MSQTQPQSNPKVDVPPRPVFRMLTFVHSVSFLGGINQATTEKALDIIGRVSSGVDIEPVKVTAQGLRSLRDGETYDGFRLSKIVMDRSGPKPKNTLHTHFVPKENVKEVSFYGE